MAKTLLVTGGSRGIGAATARLAAREGYDVAVNYQRDEVSAKAVAEEVRSLGRKAVAVRADVGSEAEILRLFAAVDEALGPLHGLVNNAGIVQPACRVEDMTAERIERMMRVNVVGAFLCAREAVRRMSTGNGGSGGVIVNISSAAARLGSPNTYVDYAASKGAVDTMTIGLAKEVGLQGIRVNAVRPGLIRTDIHASGGDPDRPNRLLDTVAIGRLGEAEEVAEAILWLLSDKASYVTGAILDVTAGR